MSAALEAWTGRPLRFLAAMVVVSEPVGHVVSNLERARASTRMAHAEVHGARSRVVRAVSVCGVRAAERRGLHGALCVAVCLGGLGSLDLDSKPVAVFLFAERRPCAWR